MATDPIVKMFDDIYESEKRTREIVSEMAYATGVDRALLVAMRIAGEAGRIDIALAISSATVPPYATTTKEKADV